MFDSFRGSLLLTVSSMALFVSFATSLPADGPVVAIGPDGKPMAVQRAPSAAFQPGGQPPGSQGKPGGEQAKQKKDGEAEKKAESPEPKVIRRDDTTDDQSDPNELEAMVGEDGKVSFQFRNQAWVELVQWLADISDQPLDWLELPGDRVNMRSPGRYTVEETRDLFNRHLLARGFTLLEVDGGLTIAKTEAINPAIVPRVDESVLATLQPHTFVRASLDVGWLPAEKLATELAPMISSNGRLTALTTTNRIEAMDAAINLRQIAHLLEQERSSANLEALAPEFKLRYLPAEEAKRMLEQFLGVEKKAPAPMTPQQIQMMQQMRQQNQGAPQTEKKLEISIVANVRQNSVIVRAPPDRVAVALEFLKRVDVPSEAMVSLADIKTRVQVFRLASLDPEKLIEIIGEMNILEPTTRVRVDKDNNALIVSGSAADRYIIDSLIERLDGSGRSFEVMPLRRLDPVEVAESISFLMGQEKEEDERSSRNYGFYGFYGGQQNEKKQTDEFRVSANSRYRQVLLWANEQEMEEVRSLLIKLGELPPPGGSRRTTRVIDASATPETYEYLQRLRQQWNRLSPNPLELPDQDQFKDPNVIPGQEDTDETDSQTEPSTNETSEDNLALASPLVADPQSIDYRLTAAQQSSATPSSDDDSQGQPETSGAGETTQKDLVPPIRSSRDFDRMFRQSEAQPPAGKDRVAAANRQPAPVRIEIDSSGNLLLVSPDTEALDQLENLMLQIAPPKRPYHVFHIEHASASWMRLNLEDYYKDLDDSDDSDSYFPWYWDGPMQQEDDGPSGLGKGAKLRFVDDPDTNTLVVTGANGEQLRTIAELIELWDVPEPVNKRKTRFTKLVTVSYGKAEKIAETVKEAYRDLLSSNDKAFAAGRGQNQGGGGGDGEPSKSRDGNGSSLQDSASGRDGGGTDFSFKGKLSMGVDSVGNTLLVSAEGEPLLDLVVDMIKQLDDAARPQGEVQVIRLPGGISGRTLQNALRPIGVEPVITGQSGQPREQSAGQPNGQPD